MTDEPTRRSDDQPDPEMERRVGRWLADTDLAPLESERGLDQLLRQFPTTPQARRRSLGRWFERDGRARRGTAGHDHPPETNRRTRLMFVPSGAIAALAILALGLTLGDTEPAPPQVGAGATHVVAADGSGSFSTLGAAVEAAADGDTILVRPGTYVEAVVIDEDITLRGDGDVEDIVISAPEDGPMVPVEQGTIASEPYALLLLDSDATVAGLTFEGSASGVILDGGSPSLLDSVVQGVGVALDGNGVIGNSVLVTNGGEARVAGNDIRDGGPIAVFGEADAVIEENTFSGGPHIILMDYGTDVSIKGNTFDGGSIRAYDGDLSGHVVIEGNRLSSPEESGVLLNYGSADIIGNHITGAGSAGISTGLERVNIIGNTLLDNQQAIRAAQREGAVADNVVRGGTSGIAVGTGVEVSGNDVEGVAGRGIDISFGSPVLRDNRSCGNGEANLFVAEVATPDIDDSNEICEDALAATTE